METIEKLLPFAKKGGITICVENLPCRKEHSFSNIYELKKLIQEFRDPNVKACFDTGHSHYTGESIYECITVFGENLATLHVHDTVKGDDRHLIPFQGEIDWEKFIKGLNDVKYKENFYGIYTITYL